jgi:hypothetical protein
MIPRCTIALVIVTSFGFSISSARSDQYPVLNVVPVCKGIASQSSLEEGLSNTSFDDCMKGEQTDREAMIKEWSTFNSDDKMHCIAETTMGGESSYTDLVTCLEMARDVRKLRSEPTTWTSGAGGSSAADGTIASDSLIAVKIADRRPGSSSK